jgi:hypothetical protein
MVAVRFRQAIILVSALLSTFPTEAKAEPATDRWWPAEVEQTLAKAGNNRSELEKALAGAPRDQRKGMAFLIANMPDSDLRSLRADFLLSNTTRTSTKNVTHGAKSFMICACR